MRLKQGEIQAGLPVMNVDYVLTRKSKIHVDCDASEVVKQKKVHPVWSVPYIITNY